MNELSVAEPQPDLDHSTPANESVEENLLEDELLVEEISIDGMCGVY